MKRRALMLITSDPVILQISNTTRSRREAAQARLDGLNQHIDDIVKTCQEGDQKSLTEIDERLSELGIAVFDKANHQISYHPDEGVIWLEQRNAACRCAVCSGQGVTFFIGSPE